MSVLLFDENLQLFAPVLGKYDIDAADDIGTTADAPRFRSLMFITFRIPIIESIER